EDLVVEVNQAWAEEEPLRTQKACGAAHEHAPQDNLVVKWQAAWADEQCLSTLKAYGAVYEHGKYSGIIPLLRNLESSVWRVSLRTCQSTYFATRQKRLSVSPRWPFQSVKVGSDFTEHREIYEPGGMTREICVSQVEEETWLGQPSWAPGNRVKETEVPRACADRGSPGSSASL
ncbi:unnamed protein product, partial [Rangifer tarandus platyrhynchus]